MSRIRRRASRSARGRGVALINAPLDEHLPHGITHVELLQPTATLTLDAVWHQGELSLIQRSLAVATRQTVRLSLGTDSSGLSLLADLLAAVFHLARRERST